MISGRLKFLVLLCCFPVEYCAAKYVEGHLVTNERWAFVARFCFLSEEGQFEYDIEYDPAYAVQNILLYYDTDDQWPSVYKSNKTCKQREAILSVAHNQVINLTVEYRTLSGCVPTRRDKKMLWTCHETRSFRSTRERWWFLAISNCNSVKGLNIKYRFLMTNGPPGDYWHEHFSADEFYILPILTGFCVAYLFVIFGLAMCTVELRSRQLLHTTYKLFICSILLQAFGIILLCIAYGRYAVDGIGFPTARLWGRVSESTSETIFLLMLLLLAKGYTVTRGRLRLSSSIKLTIFMCLYCITYVCLFIYELEFFDPGEVLYLYESPAGYGLIFLRFIAWWMFMYSTIFTLKHYPEKARFYYPFNFIGTLWFLSGPGFILAANNWIDKWVREKVVCGVEHGISLCGHIMFFILTRPSRANKNFPYHVRTTQIGIMEVGGVVGNNTMEHFGHHPYAPSAPPPAVGEWMTDVPIQLFTVSRAVVDLAVGNGALHNIVKTEDEEEDKNYSQPAIHPLQTNEEEPLPPSVIQRPPSPMLQRHPSLLQTSPMIQRPSPIIEESSLPMERSSPIAKGSPSAQQTNSPPPPIFHGTVHEPD